MSGLLVQQGDDGLIHVIGAIDTSNAAAALQQAERLLGVEGRVVVDLSRLSSTDSVTLAVLLAWAARLHRTGQRVQFTRMPEHLRALARLSEVEALLGIPAAA